MLQRVRHRCGAERAQIAHFARMHDSEKIWSVVKSTNESWRQGHPREVADGFDPDAIQLAPSGAVLLSGRKAIVDSYVEYTEAVTTHSFIEREEEVRVYGDTAIVRYSFDVTYEVQGATHTESGCEVLALTRRAGAWLIVSRMQIVGSADDR